MREKKSQLGVWVNGVNSSVRELNESTSVVFFFLINNSEIFIRTELQIVHKACTMKQEKK